MCHGNWIEIYQGYVGRGQYFSLIWVAVKNLTIDQKTVRQCTTFEEQLEMFGL